MAASDAGTAARFRDAAARDDATADARGLAHFGRDIVGCGNIVESKLEPWIAAW